MAINKVANYNIRFIDVFYDEDEHTYLRITPAEIMENPSTMVYIIVTTAANDEYQVIGYERINTMFFSDEYTIKGSSNNYKATAADDYYQIDLG